MLDNCDIEWFNTVEHLGHTLNESLSDVNEIDQRAQEFVGKSNAILSKFNFYHFRHNDQAKIASDDANDIDIFAILHLMYV